MFITAFSVLESFSQIAYSYSIFITKNTELNLTTVYTRGLSIFLREDGNHWSTALKHNRTVFI